ncbi:hypothetical protein HD554DRAFT_1457840 [Boletus coccyginus]|nr:hypothetical protein HD554DRAFT_1457840 [Boletus coccyginus]
MMHTCCIGDRSTVFACGSRTSILLCERDLLQHSPVMFKDISAAIESSTAAYPSSVILATLDALVIGAVANFDKLQIRSIPLGFNFPRHIVRPVRVQHLLSEFEVDQGDEVTSLHVFMTDLLGAPTSFLCVGVTPYNDGEREPSRRRLLLLQVNGPRACLVVMTSVSVGGCVYAITSMQNMVLTAVNGSVDCWFRETDPDDSPRCSITIISSSLLYPGMTDCWLEMH